jgi:hypothetical protein
LAQVTFSSDPWVTWLSAPAHSASRVASQPEGSPAPPTWRSSTLAVRRRRLATVHHETTTEGGHPSAHRPLPSDWATTSTWGSSPTSPWVPFHLSQVRVLAPRPQTCVTAPAGCLQVTEMDGRRWCGMPWLT